MTLEQDIKVKIEENEIIDYAFSCLPIDGEAYKEDLNFLVDELAALVREREKAAADKGYLQCEATIQRQIQFDLEEARIEGYQEGKAEQPK